MLHQPIPYAEAAEFIRDKPAVTRDTFNALLPELRGLAFVVSGIEDAGVLQRMRDRIADLPQMAGLPPTRAGKPQPARHAAAGPARPRLSPRRPVGRGLHETGGRRGFVVALGIVAVFVIGYLVGHLR